MVERTSKGEPMALAHASLTHPGRRRENNEDAHLLRLLGRDGCLAAVADGAGGEAAGEVASSLAMEVVGTFDPGARDMEAHLVALVLAANGRVLEAAAENPRHDGMGSTLTLFAVRGDHVFWAHVGDSRLYLFRNGSLTHMTQDHTVPGALLAQGDIDQERARTHPLRNYLLQCLGCPKCDPESGAAEVQAGDILLACSDGLHGELDDPTLAAVLGGGGPIAEKARALVDLALAAGGSDNITVAAVEI